MSATAKLGARIVCVSRERGPGGCYYATSDDLNGLIVSAKTIHELDELVPQAIAQLYAACGVKAIVTKIESARSHRTKQWVAVPAEIAKQALEQADALTTL